MRRNLKVGVYDPFLDTLGGGEKHILSILKVLQEEGYEIDIFWAKNLQKKIEDRFSLDYNIKIKWLPNIFASQHSLFHKILRLREYDLFFYATDGSYFLSSAKKNFIFCMVPQKSLYKMNLLNRLKTINYRFIANSYFTKQWISKWGIKSEVIYPYLNKEFIDIQVNKIKKDKIILSTGRFFKQLHSKKQYILINLFKKIKQNYRMFKNFKLILAGGLKKEDIQYFNELKSSTKKNYDIVLKPNLSFHELLGLYKKSLLYIHLAGYGINKNQKPEFLEHLGITPLEAMASGCITFCYDAGGPKEIIKDNFNGFLFNTEKELLKKMSRVLVDKVGLEKIRQNAKKYVNENFSYEVFRKRVKEVIL